MKIRVGLSRGDTSRFTKSRLLHFFSLALSLSRTLSLSRFFSRAPLDGFLFLFIIEFLGLCTARGPPSVGVVFASAREKRNNVEDRKEAREGRFWKKRKMEKSAEKAELGRKKRTVRSLRAQRVRLPFIVLSTPLVLISSTESSRGTLVEWRFDDFNNFSPPNGLRDRVGKNHGHSSNRG